VSESFPIVGEREEGEREKAEEARAREIPQRATVSSRKFTADIFFRFTDALAGIYSAAATFGKFIGPLPTFSSDLARARARALRRSEKRRPGATRAPHGRR